MSLMNTKPRWFRGEVVATESGWVNPINNEVLVAIGNLKSKLEAEQPKKIIIADSLEVAEKVVKTRKPYAPRKPKVVNEGNNMQEKEKTPENVPVEQPVEQPVKKTPKKIIGEVVEYDLDDESK